MSNWREHEAYDEKGIKFPYGRQWGDLIDYDGNMDTADALRIAMDVMEGFLNGKDIPDIVDPDEMKAAIGMLSAIRAQSGCITHDSIAQGAEDGFMATQQIDIWVFG